MWLGSNYPGLWGRKGERERKVRVVGSIRLVIITRNSVGFIVESPADIFAHKNSAEKTKTQ